MRLFSPRDSDSATRDRIGGLWAKILPAGLGGALTLVANSTMFGFVVLHGDFEHIIAAYTDSMDFRRFIARLGLVCGARMRG